MKTCKRCGGTYERWCLSCKREYARKYRLANQEKSRESKRSAVAKKHEKYVADSLRYQAEHPENHCANAKRYRATHPERCRAYTQIWADANRDKCAAERAAYRAVRDGKIIRPSTCQECGASGRIEGHHHNGYDRAYWLDIAWLCKPCHRKADLAGHGKATRRAA